MSAIVSGRAKPAKSEWKKPYKDFPLSYHPPSGRLYKTIRQRRYYFGYASDWQSAVDLYNLQRDDLQAGRTPRRADDDRVTVGELCDHFLQYNRAKMDTGELSWRSYKDYEASTDRIVRVFGKHAIAEELRSDDFARLRIDIVSSRKAVAAGNEIQRIKACFKWGYEDELLGKMPRYGRSFDKPDKRTVRRERSKKPKKQFSSDEIRSLIDAAKLPMRAFILLASNAGFKNSDCGSLEFGDIDLEGGWLDCPRRKTGEDRRAKLWPETCDAIREYVETRRPQPATEEFENRVFLTRTGDSWFKETRRDDPLCKEFRKLLDDLKIHRAHVGFAALRSTFQTEAENATPNDESPDLAAIRLIMGHSADSRDMASVYRQRIDDARLIRVSENVRRWLFPEKYEEANETDGGES